MKRDGEFFAEFLYQLSPSKRRLAALGAWIISSALIGFTWTLQLSGEPELHNYIGGSILTGFSIIPGVLGAWATMVFNARDARPRKEQP